MATFTGTDASETINPSFVSPTVTSDGGSLPSAAADIINSGGGSDTVEGGGGADQVNLGGGDDRFTWRFNDGDDILEGGAGSDRLDFYSVSNAAATGLELIQLVNNGGGRLRLSSAFAPDGALLDVNGFEEIVISAMEGADTIIVSDLAPSGLTNLRINLSAEVDGIAGDGDTDRLSLAGGSGDEFVQVSATAGGLAVSGLGAAIAIEAMEAGDFISLNGGGGNDFLSADSAARSVYLGGGIGDDKLVGSSAADILRGDEGDDVIQGGTGDDDVQLGAGDDSLIWFKGHGVDTVDGGADFDRIDLRGSGGTDTFAISAGPTDAAIEVDYAIALDIRAVERVDFVDFGGSDLFSIGDLTGTSLRQIFLDVGSDIDLDLVVLQGSAGADTVLLADIAGRVRISGLTATVSVERLGRIDEVHVFAGNGDDTIDASAAGDGPGLIVLRGEDGNDRLVGGARRESLSGGFGDDIVDYRGSVAGVTLLLDDGRGFGGDAAGDVLIEFEHAFGSAFADILEGSHVGNSLSGGAGGDQLYGHDGDDRLVGGTGADRSHGGTGDDLHFVDNAADVARERLGEGIADRVFAGIDYALAGGSEIELLTTTDAGGSAGIDLTGNEFGNRITGNAGINRLAGGGGGDTLSGLGGGDLLIGGAGTDRSDGGAGDDAHVVDSAADIVVERAGEGNDRILAGADYGLRGGVHVETLAAATGTAAIDLAGNEFANRVGGNDGANILQGRGGADVLEGGGGADRFAFRATDHAGLGAGRDTIVDFQGAGAAGGDRIDLGSIDAIQGGADDAFALIGNAAFSAPGQLRVTYNPNLDVTTISGNTDADSDAEFQIALSGNQVALNAADFIL